ncbi:MAG: L,D-transpeptidase [Actinobacteria bacterium]|nr:L,D-transpeptidase [Actinomycetota bacterium]
MTLRPPTASLARAAGLAAIVTVSTLVLAACGGSTSPKSVRTVTVPPSSSASSSSAGAASSASSSAATGAPVHVKILESDGNTYGVGMPIVAYFSQKITDASAFAKATKVTIDGAAANGAWYFEDSAQISGYPLEAHYRTQNFWPGHAQIKMEMPVKGLSAGTGLVFDDSLTLSMATGPANISTVDASSLRMTVTSDGATVKTIPVSLGAAKTPTYNGTKIVMQKGSDQPDGTLYPNGAVRMIGPGYNEMVDWSVRVTNSGEYVHAAPWNSRIGQVSTSNGCTNLSVADAQWFYNLAQVGDPIVYANTNGSQMPSWDGFGDWNVPWAQWQEGGEVSS